MEFNTLVNELNKRQNGSFISLSWKRQLPVYKEYKGNIVVEKVVKSTIRKGINPKNTAFGKAKLKADLEANVQYPREDKTTRWWGEWIPGYEGILLKNKDKTYLRVFLSPNKAKVSYFINGEFINKDDLFAMPFLTADAKKGFDGKTDYFIISIDNITSIG